MGLSSAQLEAFSELAKTRSFSKAAKNLHLTQSALSQRIQNLESELTTGLIVRDPGGLRLTPAGEELLRYCHVRESLEGEALKKISAGRHAVGGTLRIAGFSSIIRSVVMPALNPVVAGHADVNVEFFVREISELFSILSHNGADVILTTEPSQRHDIINHLLGYEENVLVEGRQPNKRNEIYLDHDPNDLTTAAFFKLNGAPHKKLRRNYLDEVYSLIDGAKQGWGRAVLPRHLVDGDRELRIVKGYKPLRIPVFLQHYRQPFYSALQSKVIDKLSKNVPKILQRKGASSRQRVSEA